MVTYIAPCRKHTFAKDVQTELAVQAFACQGIEPPQGATATGKCITSIINSHRFTWLNRQIQHALAMPYLSFDEQEPLSVAPAMRDLIVDMTMFFKQYESVKP